MRSVRTILPILLTLALSCAAYAAPGDDDAPGLPPPSYKLKPGQPFPAFKLRQTSGARVTKKSMLGRYTVVRFYFADCPPCLDTFPGLESLPARFPRIGFLSMTPEPLTVAREIAVQYNFPWTTLPEAQNTIRAIGVDDYPSFAIVGPNGKLLAIDTAARILATDKSIGDWIERLARKKR